MNRRTFLLGHLASLALILFSACARKAIAMAFPTPSLTGSGTMTDEDRQRINEHFADASQHTPDEAPTTGGMATVATMSDLKALSPADGDSVYLLGYYAPSDGGGGVFRYDPLASAMDNGGTVIQPNVGSGRWLRN